MVCSLAVLRQCKHPCSVFVSCDEQLLSASSLLFSQGFETKCRDGEHGRIQGRRGGRKRNQSPIQEHLWKDNDTPSCQVLKIISDILTLGFGIALLQWHLYIWLLSWRGVIVWSLQLSCCQRSQILAIMSANLNVLLACVDPNCIREPEGKVGEQK